MNRFLGSVALVAGTAIGAGMLSLPVVTASMGFVPSIVVFCAMAALMSYVGLLILEVIDTLPANATMISMAAATLGSWGKRAAAGCYFFLLLALNIAYLSGATGQILCALNLPPTLTARAALGALLSFGCGWLAAAHTERVDRVNRWLFAGLVGSFAAMFFSVLPFIELQRLEQTNYLVAFSPLALILTSFGYHPIIPNIFDYLGRDLRRTRAAILVGTTIPLLVYLLWQLMVLGSVPLEGEWGLRQAYDAGVPATVPLSAHLQLSYLTPLISLFALLAILTSFLGTMLALAEFVADALGWSIDAKTKPRIALAIAAPLLLFSLLGTRLFVSALGYAGIWAAILLGWLPITMAALLRTRSKRGRYRVWGGYGVMLLAWAAFALVIGMEIQAHC